MNESNEKSLLNRVRVPEHPSEGPKDEKELLKINISRIIHASRWRVIRQLTRVWEFPQYVPTIKEVQVVGKSHNTIKTKWRILVDGLAINWIEEDSLALKQNAIYFQAVDGDLKEFRGAWHFSEHPEGTEVKISVSLNVGIPAIGDFAEEYVKTLIIKNFESILDFLENHLISRRYSSFKKGDVNKVAGFGLIGHFYNLKHLGKGLKMINPNYNIPSDDFLGKLFDVTPSFKICDMKDYKSRSGEATTNGCIILCTFIPSMIENDLKGVYAKVVRACKLAEKFGMGVVSLGGFTSIVAERFGQDIRQEVDIPVTTGNTLAAAYAVEGVEKAALLLGKELKDLKVTVIGGTGDVGSGCSRALTEKVRQLTVTGRNRWNLIKLKGELKKRRKAKIEAHTNNEKAVKDADIVIAAANSSASILNIEWFKPGAVVCDLAYPKNLSYKSTRKDIFVFSGGLASVPTPVDLSIMMGLPSGNICYGCSCESIVLALERRYESFSFGRGNITPEKITEIRAMAHKHGFDLAPFFWSDQIIDNQVIEGIKKASRHA
jgi:predicted amino acid dehydrogenase/ribosome-associated toxin RatA of RatAB toxin-antitoxin module